MKKLALFSLLALPFLLGRSDEPAPEGVAHWSATALSRVTQSLSADAASDPHHFAVKQLTDFPNESFLLVHREANGQPEWHETQADVFFVQSGSATLVVGGTLLNGETVAPHENAMARFKAAFGASSSPETSFASRRGCRTSYCSMVRTSSITWSSK